MKKAVVVVLLLFACGRREHVAQPPAPSAPPRQTTAPAPPLSVPKPHPVSTPQKCAGDGSYGQAVECFRMSSGFNFHVTAPGLKAIGALRRPRIGEEHVTIGEWSAETKPGGIVWTRGGKLDHPTPELERLYQRLTLYLDPQKKEGQPQLAGSAGGTNHYHFTDANNGDAYDVYVAKDDGHITRVKVGNTEVAIE